MVFATKWQFLTYLLTCLSQGGQAIPEGRPLYECWPKKIVPSTITSSGRDQSLRSGSLADPALLWGWEIKQMTDD